ncbi:MAG: HesA/MoeB/ThiF family protein [Planctomycetes bacterium]|nr:HesA/MoeB/ThiF family protein [Planctomycetota bacterium]
MGFSEEQIKRYSRHLVLREVGGVGQRRLLDASVLVVGAGGLGCPAALYLAAAGVGRIAIADHDTVDLTNLHRQVLFTQADIGRPKAEAAAAALRRANPDVTTEALAVRITPGNVRGLVKGRSLVVEGTDDAETKFAVNDACCAEGVPLVIGGVVRWSGQLLAVLPGRTACYRCVFEAPPAGDAETCEAAGVIGPAAGAVGTLMAVEACKILLGTGDPLAGRMRVLDFLKSTSRDVAWKRRPGCPGCDFH